MGELDSNPIAVESNTKEEAIPKIKSVAEVDGEFGKLFIEDQAGRRLLRFDSKAIQAMMSLDTPHKLISLPLQYQLAPLLWQDTTPSNILLAGIGGGDLVRFLKHNLPKTNITAVDRDATMLDLAQRYFHLPDENIHCRYFIEDAEIFMQNISAVQPPKPFELIVVDLHLEKGMPDFLNTPKFYETCRTNLSSEGILTINLLPRNKSHLIEIMKTIRIVFNRKCLYAAIPDHDNISIYAFNDFPMKNFSFGEIEERCHELSKDFDIDFSIIWQNIRALNPILTNAKSDLSLSDILSQ